MVQEAADRASKYQTEKKKNTYQTEVIVKGSVKTYISVE